MLLVLIPIFTGTTKYVLSKSTSPHTAPVHATTKVVTPTPSAIPTSTQTASGKYTTASSTPTALQTKQITPTPTAAITKDTVAPTITSVGGPSNGQTVTFSNFCFPIVVSDNVSSYPNITVRTQFDSGSWTDWSTNVSPCYNNVSNGSHTFSVQAKDAVGNISTTVTRTFTVAAAQNITISIAGHLFADANCNNVRDNGESDISNDPTTVNVFLMPQFSIYLTGTTDNNGQFSLSKSILDTDTVTLQVSPVAPSGYKSHGTPPTVTLSKSNTSTVVDIPFVPNEDVGLCQ